MDSLNTKIKNILTEKTLKVKPENVKKGVTILGITGTYEGTGGNAVINTVMSGSGSEAIKSSIIELPLLNVSQITNLSALFSGYKSLVNFSLTDTSHIINMSAMFSNCTNLVSVPSLDTSNVVNMSSMFERCSSLENVPVLNMAKVIYLSNMFLQSFALSDNSLDNIMESCITVTDAYTGNKTLKTLGINSTLANRCPTLSNYQAFLDAGWTTGY